MIFRDYEFVVLRGGVAGAVGDPGVAGASPSLAPLLGGGRRPFNALGIGGGAVRGVLGIGRVEVGGAGAIDVRVCDCLTALENQHVGAFGGGREAVGAVDGDDAAGLVLVVSAVSALADDLGAVDAVGEGGDGGGAAALGVNPT